MRLTPIADGVLVCLDPLETTWGADSKLVRPDIGKEKPVWGEVLAVGPGRTTKRGVQVAPSVHRGERVFVPWATGHDLKVGGRLCVRVTEGQILAVDDGNNG
jgi:chaperonin GroES